MEKDGTGWNDTMFFWNSAESLHAMDINYNIFTGIEIRKYHLSLKSLHACNGHLIEFSLVLRFASV
jgi:hypothetical protein